MIYLLQLDGQIVKLSLLGFKIYVYLGWFKFLFHIRAIIFIIKMQSYRYTAWALK